MTVAEMYRLLELEEGADPAAVKKAYFRLIRKFPPEQNPEAFRQLRQAYEALKDGPPKEKKKEDWVTWKNPIIGYMLELADKCDENEDYDKACDIIGDALKIEPDNVMLHLIMARYQMLGMHPQNAAKYAEYVTQKLPDNREGWLLLANGYQNRGWYKKAVPAFERAYELGCRDPGFLLERITNIAQNGNTDEAEALFKQYAESTPCNDDTRIMILECFQRWSEIITPTPGRISEFLHMFDRFLRKEAKKIDQMMFMSPLTELANHRKDVITDKTNRQRISQSIQAMADRNMIPGRHAAILISDMLQWSVLLNPADLQPSWADLGRTLSQAMENDPGLRRYVETDALLCLASDPERTKAEIPLIRAEYPELAESYASYLEAIEKDETDQLLKKLKWEFEKMSSNYEGSRYEDLYGRTESNRAERRNKREKWDSFVDGFVEEPEEPFVREKDKVGRNDPCPCGSGKKFKKCCMGKGIYD